ncbi:MULTISPECIES: UDP-N-acetylglucosamine 2-epimerase [Cellvibrio]|uniref:UDP-N-acetylglucosamine 2-epimerase (Hydrolyzing) n=1 Tax=Cellvibrio fibrivorans TaxID=126350 RepID=A0ABU1UW89_9GAMM|nr:UDP-N-acetylglucosamine 2-epimerase [Cellvibrio fibrivorans]MDR7089420.1 UDP-N-acetylglucosamine 2-epimerase (hydrolyzing) [Cellvibrio fibrivorans]
MRKNIVFLSGTRADFGKIRSLLDILQNSTEFEAHIFVTGMHMLRKYGYTCREIERRGYKNIYQYINQNYSDTMDSVLAKTIAGLSDYVKEIQPDMLVVHGDRVEALAGAIVGSLNNILVAHIEGGEVSGTIDDLIRHSVSKLSHLHFVTNERAKQRLIQLGEIDKNIYPIGSPDVDSLFSPDLPSLDEVKNWYGIPFEKYSILLYHPVTTEVHDVERQIHELVNAVVDSEKNYVVIYPNNDSGSERIINEYGRIENNTLSFKVYPSMRFDYFLTLLKNAEFIIGNSSSALMEAPYYGVPAINIGTRQANRANLPSVINCFSEFAAIKNAIASVESLPREPIQHFGEGDSSKKFFAILQSEQLWEINKQKTFVDM